MEVIFYVFVSKTKNKITGKQLTTKLTGNSNWIIKTETKKRIALGLPSQGYRKFHKNSLKIRFPSNPKLHTPTPSPTTA